MKLKRLGFELHGETGEPARCCPAMERQIDWSCDQHDSRWDCNKAVLCFVGGDVGIMYPGLGNRPYQKIAYCPWCGAELNGGKLKKSRSSSLLMEESYDETDKRTERAGPVPGLVPEGVRVWFLSCNTNSR